jgi:hypothetical protein
MTSSTDILPPPPSPDEPRPTRQAPAAPPQWAIERFINRIGVVPAALKRILDRLAKVPGLNVFFAIFSSVWFGIAMLFLIGVYVGIGSGFASLRAKYEMTDMEFFNAWPMRVLVACLALDLTIVTLRRIPLTLFKLGVWTVHVGILTLLAGSVIYFSQKHEGSVRIFLNQTAGDSYDVTERALYTYAIKPDGTPDKASAVMTPLPGLPIYHEHFEKAGNGLNMPVAGSALGNLNPALTDASLKVVSYFPYAYLENEWQPASANDPAAAKTGHHAVFLSFSAAGAGADGKWFVSNTAKNRLYDIPQMPFSIEYVRHPAPEKLADITAEFTGPLGLTVRTKGVTKTLAVEEGRPIAVEGTPYTLTPRGQTPMPILSKGYEGTFSNILRVHVARKDSPEKTAIFERNVVARYPEISPDFIEEKGQQKRIQERVDNDIQISFHDAQRDEFWLVENNTTDPAKKFEIYHRKAGGGKVDRHPVKIRTPVTASIGRTQMHLNVLEETDRAVEVARPQIVPPQQRDRGQTAMDAMQMSIVELSFTKGDIRDRRFFVPFVQFAQIGTPPMGRQPTIINVPGAGQVGFLLSTTKRSLPTEIKLLDFQAIKYPGAANSYRDYVSTLEFTDKASGQKETRIARLNEPAESQGLYYFQNSWDGDLQPGVRFSVLGVGNRPGTDTMLIGSILIMVGIGYAFYVKPILINKKKKFLASWNAGK